MFYRSGWLRCVLFKYAVICLCLRFRAGEWLLFEVCRILWLGFSVRVVFDVRCLRIYVYIILLLLLYIIIHTYTYTIITLLLYIILYLSLLFSSLLFYSSIPSLPISSFPPPCLYSSSSYSSSYYPQSPISPILLSHSHSFPPSPLIFLLYSPSQYSFYTCRCLLLDTYISSMVSYSYLYSFQVFII